MDDKLKLFKDIDAHLMNDERPSQYLQSLSGPIFEKTHPFKMLALLKNVEQSKLHHPEGSVWNHTLMVVDEAAARKDEAVAGSRVFMWAALLHDIGKGPATKIRNGRITAYDHDKVGKKIAIEFLKEFEDEIFVSKVAALVRWHMQILFAAKNMHFADFDGMKSETDVRDVALLGLCDRLGRAGSGKKEAEEAVRIFLEKAGL